MVNAQIANGYTDEGLITSVGTPITSSNTNNNTTNSTIENLTIQNLSTTMSQSYNIYSISNSVDNGLTTGIATLNIPITIKKKIKITSIEITTFGTADGVSPTDSNFTTAYYITLNGQNIIGTENNPIYSNKYTQAANSMTLVTSGGNAYGGATMYVCSIISHIDFPLPYSQVLNINDIIQCTTTMIYGNADLSHITFTITGIEVD